VNVRIPDTFVAVNVERVCDAHPLVHLLVVFQSHAVDGHEVRARVSLLRKRRRPSVSPEHRKNAPQSHTVEENEVPRIVKEMFSVAGRCRVPCRPPHFVWQSQQDALRVQTFDNIRNPRDFGKRVSEGAGSPADRQQYPKRIASGYTPSSWFAIGFSNSSEGSWRLLAACREAARKAGEDQNLPGAIQKTLYQTCHRKPTAGNQLCRTSLPDPGSKMTSFHFRHVVPQGLTSGLSHVCPPF
jgi:hypothetical protein